jgi:hypothetical protein
MVPIKIIAPKFLKLISVFINVYAITLFPFIVSREEMNERVLRHETIHICQQKELLVLFFYLLYLWDFCHGLFKYKSRSTAYRRIRFEQEAYTHESDKEYLDTRPWLNWRSYKV